MKSLIFSCRQLKIAALLVPVFMLFSGSIVWTKDLCIVFPLNLPPWTLQADDSGIAVDIVRKSLKLKGHHLKTEYLSLKLLNLALKADCDAHAQVESRTLKGFYSDKILDFQTSLISLKPNGFIIGSVNDLQDKHIIAFPNASVLFGNAFQASKYSG